MIINTNRDQIARAYLHPMQPPAAYLPTYRLYTVLTAGWTGEEFNAL